MDHPLQLASLNALFFHNLDNFQHERLLTFHRDGKWTVYSSADFARAVIALRRFLLSQGLMPGDHVAVFSENRPEWHIADFAILLAGMVVVPVYSTLSPAQIEHILLHSGARAIVVSGVELRLTLEPMLGSLTHLRTIISMEDLPRIVAQTPVESADSIREECLAVGSRDTASIVYTSGTTATSKGVILSHGNFIFDVEQSLRRMGYQTAERALSVLPLSHVFERLLCYGYFRQGVPIAYGDPYGLQALLKLHHPTVMGCVPRVLEKVREAVDAGIAAMPPWRQKIGRTLIASGIAHARGSGGVSAAVVAPLAELLVFRKIRRQLGGLQFVCGGAWLDPELEMFFRTARLKVVQGYGMTETSPVIALNDPENPKPGSVGLPLDGVEVRVDEDGEILTRGPHVMQGYWGDAEATANAFRDGWLRTGDLGRLDEDGALRITGRRKEIVILSNGKNIVCAGVEQALQRSPYIQQAFVTGDLRNYPAAILVPHRLNLLAFARSRAIALDNEDELLRHPVVQDLYRREVTAHQHDLSRFEQVKRFCFMPEEALLDPELVTPSQKMRRKVLETHYAAWIQQMYSREELLVLPIAPVHAQARVTTGVQS